MKQDQHVIACIESPDRADAVIATARHCAEHLNHKGVVLLNVCPDGNNLWLKDYGLPYIGLKGDWKPAIEGLPTTFGGILAVCAVDPSAPRSSITNPATLLRTFSTCKIAYLAVHTPLSTLHSPLSTILTVDHSRESKEKLIWASYFARFLSGSITLACPAYRDEGLRQRQRNNLRFADKFFRSVDVTYNQVAISDRRFTPADLTALAELTPDLLISRAVDRRDLDVGDWLVGSPQLRLLRHTHGTPVLFLNQRDDLYVLCD